MLKILKTKLAIAIALVAALSLLLTPAVFAAGEGTSTGSFGATSQAPTIAINIWDNIGCTGAPVTSMNPLTEYWAKVTVTENNKLKHLDTVKATIYYDSNASHPAAPGTGNTQTCAILTCTVGTSPTWSSDFGSPVPSPTTTWQLISFDCSQPANLELTTGDWKFAFKPGKVATESRSPAVWDAEGKATNKNSQSGVAYANDKNMNWYGEITVNTSSIDWGSVPLGLMFADSPNPKTASTLYIANGNYYQDVKSDNWTSGEMVTLDTTGGNPPSGDGQFALKANATSDNTTWATVTRGYNHISSTGTITVEAGNPVTSNNLWLSLSATGILPGTYSGTIWYQIATR